MDGCGQTHVHSACQFHNFEVARTIVKAGVDINARNKCGQTPLHLCIERRHDCLSDFDFHKMALVLIVGGADVNTVDNEGSAPLHLCAKRKAYDMFPMLVEAGANVNATNGDGKTPLQIVESNGDLSEL